MRLVRIIAKDFGDHVRFPRAVLYSLHDDTEYYLADLTKNSNLCVIHAKRITVTPPELKQARCLRGHISNLQ